MDSSQGGRLLLAFTIAIILTITTCARLEPIPANIQVQAAQSSDRAAGRAKPYPVPTDATASQNLVDIGTLGESAQKKRPPQTAPAAASG